jgi:hypothetical protein
LLDDGKTARIELLGRDGTVRGHTLVDLADLDRVLQKRWCLHVDAAQDRRCVMARTAGGRKNSKVIRLHTFLLQDVLLPKQEVDHKNGDTLDNRRENLRPATRTQNGRNITRFHAKSGYKGVCRVCKTKTPSWFARIYVDNKPIHLGCFATPEEAARAYNEAALMHHGEFAHLNEVPSV